MGVLVGSFCDSFLADENKKDEGSDPIISFRMSSPDGDINEMIKKPLAVVVEDRNELVHHFLERLSVDMNGLTEAELFLEKQKERLKVEISKLDTIIAFVRDSLVDD